MTDSHKKPDEQNTQKDMKAQTNFVEVTMWQKSPGTAIYNSQGVVVGGLRLQPSVTIYDIKEGWARIHADEDKWVQLSDLVDEKPEGLLSRPIESNRLLYWR